MSRLSDVLRALLGVSAYAPAPVVTGALTDAEVERARERVGGNIQPIPNVKLRWYLDDVERAAYVAGQGNLQDAAQLYRAMRQDGIFAGLLAQRTSGLVRLPKRFYGDAKIVAELEARNGTRSVFESLCPPSETALLAADGVMLGVAIGEIVPVVGRDYGVLVRLEPEFLTYRWSESAWYYRSIAGALRVTPGDGRWVLHVPGGRLTPWQHGLWQSCGRAFVTKTHAALHRSNYSAKLANPARVAKAVAGATEAQRVGFLSQVIAWGLNTVFELPPGWDVSLLESNGRGWQVFSEEIADADREYMIALAGQIVTTTGGSGFANADIHKSIRADLIKDTGDGLAYTLNTQVIPSYVAAVHGVDAVLEGGASVEWDTSPPKDLKIEAESLIASGEAIEKLSAVLAAFDMNVDATVIADRFGIPAVAVAEKRAVAPNVQLAPTDIAKVVRVDEARAGAGLPAWGDAEGALTVFEFSTARETAAEVEAAPAPAPAAPTNGARPNGQA